MALRGMAVPGESLLGLKLSFAGWKLSIYTIWENIQPLTQLPQL
jgi:hypothetical protein